MQITPLPIRQGCAGFGSHGQHRYAIALVPQIRGRLQRTRPVKAIGNQQYLSPWNTCLLHQFSGLEQTQIGTAALDRHEVRVQRIEQ